MTRRLAAILAADVVGYSRLVSANEADALARLGELRREIIAPAVAKHDGRLFKIMGDGFLADFSSAVQAVRCAVVIQDATEQAAMTLDETRKMRLRIGIHVGDVMVEADDLMGDGVNIAARLEGIAAPGSISISRAVHDQVRDRLDVAFEDKGEVALKNIARPVQVFALATGGRAASSSQVLSPPLALPDKPSIAVLPFQNISGDPEQDYFADGMVEDIITALSRFKSLFVIARNSSFTYKGKAVDIKQVGRELGVRYVLEGSVRKAGNKIRIAGQLIDALSGAHIWADRYDREFLDIFELQDEIARNVVAAIEPNLMQAEIVRVRAKPTETLAAYDFYLKALPEFHSFTEAGFIRSRDSLLEALRRDQNFSDAWAALADCTARMAVAGWLDWTEASEQACHAARRAIETDPENGVGLAIAAFTLAMAASKFEEASEIADRALSLHPNSSSVCTNCGWVFIYNAQYERALTVLEAGRRLSPLDPRAYLNMNATATAHLYSKDFEQSLAWSERVLSKWPAHAVSLQVRAAALSLLGRLAEARVAVARLLEVKPSATIRVMRRLRIADSDIREQVIEGLRRAGLPE